MTSSVENISSAFRYGGNSVWFGVQSASGQREAQPAHTYLGWEEEVLQIEALNIESQFEWSKYGV